ncbi:MAG: hypothetical protein Q8K63_09985 [Acidimicrobiales bacterium]|nr:hypothetical protein [Acidimicrobiales bacterium]
MASGEVARPGSVVVERVVDASPDEIADHLTEFALEYGLQVNRRRDGEGMALTRQPSVPVAEHELFRPGDELTVLIAAEGAGSAITLAATMAGLHQRGDDWKRGRAIRGGVLSAFFVWLGVKGLTPTVGVGDFVMFGLGGMFTMRTVRAVRHEEIDRNAYEDDVHAALSRLCDRLDEAYDF